MWLAYILVAILASIQGLDPAESLDDCTKLLWFGSIPVAGTLIVSRHRASMLLKAYIYGSVVRAAEILLIRIPVAWHNREDHIPHDILEQASMSDSQMFMHEIVHQGSMNHGQILMIAMIAAAGLIFISKSSAKIKSRVCVDCVHFVLLGLAILANFKRGSWMALTFVLGLFALLTGKLRLLAILGLVLILCSFHPYVRARMANLQDEFDVNKGGRLVMWTKIAPALMHAHPYGVGFRGVTAKVMQATAKQVGVRVESDRNHLHSNFVEIPVTIGWVGFTLYLMWMGTALLNGFSTAYAVGDNEGKILALTYSMMLLALILNGIIEYNMADAYIVLPYGLLTGVLGNAKKAFQVLPAA
jgi:hypothetical protein